METEAVKWIYQKQTGNFIVSVSQTGKNTIWDIAFFVRDKVITMDELEGFSEDLINAVKLILSR